MVFTTAGGGANQLDTGYNIDNSMRFNRGDAACLRKTFSGSPTSTKICTISFWTKLADPSNTDSKAIFSAIKSGSNEDVIKFMGVNNGILNAIEINFNNTNNGAMMISSGASTLIKFRDPSAWYHLVIAIDSSQGTASNRVKAYINGTQHDVEARVEGGSITDDIALTQNYELGFLTASAHSIGENVESAGNEPYDGYLSEFYFIDGQQLAPTEFAETNDNGVWVPKEYEGTYGNYGFFLEFQQTGTSANASGKGADTSGNDNHFDDANATAEDITTDTPTNNFCTINPLDSGTVTFAEGNCEITCTNGNDDGARGTIGVQNGKWYFEFKLISHAGGDPPQILGVAQSDAQLSTYPSSGNYAVYEIDSGKKRINGSQSTYGATATDNDIIGVALNMDDNEVTFYKNGSSQGTITSATSSGEFYFPYIIDGSTARGHTTQANFGNPPFSISSGNSDANGYGNFEYAVPSGYYALCTKNLAEYG